jgi:hypothetical protein
MNNLPDRPLVVKCTFDKWHKRITFNSARNCSYDLLRRKVVRITLLWTNKLITSQVEQGFALSASSYAITYKDDDGEITNITTNDDLGEAIQYFQAGDDAPSSSAASILSGRSFGARKITLRVAVTVDYDGPSLSDTSSLASLDDFKVRNNSQQSFSIISAPAEVDDDSVTVSSRDPGLSAVRNTGPVPPQQSISKQQSFQTFKSLGDEVASSQRMKSTNGILHHGEPLDIDNEILAASERFPSDPSSVFQRLKLAEVLADDGSSIDADHLAASERGAAWLRDQNERAIRSKIGALREPQNRMFFHSHPRILWMGIWLWKEIQAGDIITPTHPDRRRLKLKDQSMMTANKAMGREILTKFMHMRFGRGQRLCISIGWPLSAYKAIPLIYSPTLYQGERMVYHFSI